jgi:hypothetical protein
MAKKEKEQEKEKYELDKNEVLKSGQDDYFEKEAKYTLLSKKKLKAIYSKFYDTMYKLLNKKHLAELKKQAKSKKKSKTDQSKSKK